jgi:predicted O-methyltransferase YrrM
MGFIRPECSLIFDERIRKVLRQARFAASLAVRDPRLLGDYACWAVEGWRHQPVAARQHHPGVLTVDECVALVEEEFGAWEAGPSWARVREWSFDPRARMAGRVTIAGDTKLGQLVYEVARATRPDTIVETGVATGVTSAHLLGALEDNGHGVLHSIDLPPTDMIAAGYVGAAVPDELRHRWVYHWGASRRLLPKVLDGLQGRLMFVHDSDHSYANMAWEIRNAWQAMGSGGVIVCDDVDLHTAFPDTASELDARPRFVEQAEKGGAIGLLIRVKPEPALLPIETGEGE